MFHQSKDFRSDSISILISPFPHNPTCLSSRCLIVLLILTSAGVFCGLGDPENRTSKSVSNWNPSPCAEALLNPWVSMGENPSYHDTRCIKVGTEAEVIRLRFSLKPPPPPLFGTEAQESLNPASTVAFSLLTEIPAANGKITLWPQCSLALDAASSVVPAYLAARSSAVGRAVRRDGTAAGSYPSSELGEYCRFLSRSTATAGGRQNV